MIPVGKLIVTLIWAFWIMSISTAEGQKMMSHDHSKMSEKEKKEVQKLWKEEESKPRPEYNPTYGSTYKRIEERGHIMWN